MIKLAHSLIILLLCSAFFISGALIQINAQDTERAHAPKVSDSFPREDSLPPQFINAAERLFELGFPDPRNCEYRQIEIKISSVWGNSSNVKIHGWLLPVKAGERRRLGIGWNGVIYSVNSIGEIQDVREDILDMLEFEDQRQARQKQEGSEPIDQPQRSLLRIFSASQQSLTPVKALLLLKLGETELSAKVWNAAVTDFDNHSSDEVQVKDPFLQLASAWT